MEQEQIEKFQGSLTTIETLLANVLDSLADKTESQTQPADNSSEHLKEILIKVNQLSKSTSQPSQKSAGSDKELINLTSKIEMLIQDQGEGISFNKATEALFTTTHLSITKLQKELAQSGNKNTLKGKTINLSDSTRKFSYWLNSIALLSVFLSVGLSLWYIDSKTADADFRLEEAKQIQETYKNFPSVEEYNWYVNYYKAMKEANPNDTKKWQAKNPYPSN